MIEGLVMGLSSTRGGDTELIMFGETQLSSSGSGLVSTLACPSSSATRASSLKDRMVKSEGKDIPFHLEVVFCEEFIDVHHKEIILVELGLDWLLPEFRPWIKTNATLVGERCVLCIHPNMLSWPRGCWVRRRQSSHPPPAPRPSCHPTSWARSLICKRSIKGQNSQIY